LVQAAQERSTILDVVVVHAEHEDKPQPSGQSG
jgi:hypothetical protein